MEVFFCRHLAIVLTVDLSQPDEMIATVDTLMENIRERIETLLSRDNNYITKEGMRQRSRQRFGETHEDASDVNPFLVPLLVIGTKHDIFQVKLSHPYSYSAAHLIHSNNCINSCRDLMWRKRRQFLATSDWPVIPEEVRCTTRRPSPKSQ